MNIDRPIQMHDVILAIMVIADLRLNELQTRYTMHGHTSYLPTSQGKVLPLKVINPHSESR